MTNLPLPFSQVTTKYQTYRAIIADVMAAADNNVQVNSTYLAGLLDVPLATIKTDLNDLLDDGLLFTIDTEGIGFTYHATGRLHRLQRWYVYGPYLLWLALVNEIPHGMFVFQIARNLLALVGLYALGAMLI